MQDPFAAARKWAADHTHLQPTSLNSSDYTAPRRKESGSSTSSRRPSATSALARDRDWVRRPSGNRSQNGTIPEEEPSNRGHSVKEPSPNMSVSTPPTLTPSPPGKPNRDSFYPLKRPASIVSNSIYWLYPTNSFPAPSLQDSSSVRTLDPSSIVSLSARKFLKIAPVIQVLNSNTILKDRYLLLFNDLILIARQVGTAKGGPLSQLPKSVTVPINATEPEEPQTDPLMQSLMVKAATIPLLETRNIIPLSTASLIQLRESEPSIHSAHVHPIVANGTAKFNTSPEMGINYLIAKKAVINEPRPIANFLYKATDLNKRQVGRYLGHPSNGPILEAFLDNFRFAGIRIDESLRLFLMNLRLPGEVDKIETVLQAFAKRWCSCNIETGWDQHVCLEVVMIILWLNTEMWTKKETEAPDSATTPNSRKGSAGSAIFSANLPKSPQVTSLQSPSPRAPSLATFLHTFRSKEPDAPVPDSLLTSIYNSLSTEKLALNDSDLPSRILIKSSQFPVRLTVRVASAPITLTIPTLDPNLTIRLHGQDMRIDPSYLTFETSNEASFTITGLTAGRKQIMLTKTGSSARTYKDLPTRSICVERGFMKYVFQVGTKGEVWERAPEPKDKTDLKSPIEKQRTRKYMFAVPTRSDQAQWVTLLTHYMARARESPEAQNSMDLNVRRSEMNELPDMIANVLLHQSIKSLTPRKNGQDNERRPSKSGESERRGSKSRRGSASTTKTTATTNTMQTNAVAATATTSSAGGQKEGGTRISTYGVPPSLSKFLGADPRGLLQHSSVSSGNAVDLNSSNSPLTQTQLEAQQLGQILSGEDPTGAGRPTPHPPGVWTPMELIKIVEQNSVIATVLRWLDAVSYKDEM